MRWPQIQQAVLPLHIEQGRCSLCSKKQRLSNRQHAVTWQVQSCELVGVVEDSNTGPLRNERLGIQNTRRMLNILQHFFSSDRHRSRQHWPNLLKTCVQSYPALLPCTTAKSPSNTAMQL
jgi:hypothetical protein